MAIDDKGCRFTYIIGDFNAKIGKNEGEKCTGKYGLGERNERGQRLVEFSESNNFFIMNTFFQKHPDKKWTWISPDRETKNEIDFILTHGYRNTIKNIETISEVNIGSDHKPLGASLSIQIHRKAVIKTTKGQILTTNQLRELSYEEKVCSKLTEENLSIDLDMELQHITKILITTKEEILSTCPKEKNSRNFPANIKNLLKKRRQLKTNFRKKIEYTEISKTIRKEIESWLQSRKQARMELALETGGKLKHKPSGKKQISAIKDEAQDILTEKQEIIGRIQRYYENLYYDTQYNIDEEQVEKWEMEDEGILLDEVEAAIRSLKDGKAAGLDGITVEMIKAGGGTVSNILRKIFNTCLEKIYFPAELGKAHLLLIHKKGDLKILDNYRPLSLLSAIYKVFAKIIYCRIEKALEFNLTKHQAGFRKGFSTTDHILVINQLINRSKEYSFPLCLLFLDYEKAFDSITFKAIYNTLRYNSSINRRIINIIMKMYQCSLAVFRLGNNTVEIKISKGAKQGDVLSPKIFIAVLQDLMNSMDWEGKGININGEWLNHLEFADDQVIVGKNVEEVQGMVRELIQRGEEIGLKLNLKKCKYMVLNTDGDLKIKDEKVEKVRSFKYLGQVITLEDKNLEISMRCSAAWKSLLRNKQFFRSKASPDLKKKLWESTVLPTLTYGCETWPLNQTVIRKLRVAVRGMERYILNITRRDRKTKKWIRQSTKFPDVAWIIQKRKWKWAGHLVRENQDKWTKNIINWYPWNYKRKRGRPPTPWDLEMRTACGGTTWQRVAEERKEWKRLGEAHYLARIQPEFL